jgi:hypothetical protein
MRSALLLSCLMLVVPCLRAQNLVPNWSFEEISSCPHYQGEIEKAVGWLTFRGTESCELYHVCGHPDSCGVPWNMYGEQWPSHGDGYAGIHTFSDDDGWPWYTREWIGIQLTEPMVAGATYHASLKVSLALGRGAPHVERCRFANDRNGLLFTTTHWVQNDFHPVPGYAQIYGTDVVEDTLGWTVISGSFVADSAYRYVVVGNFFSDEETNWSLMDPNGTGYLAYYYIDEVCVSPDPLYCAQQSGIDGTTTDPFRVWSDASTGSLHVAGLQGSGVLNLWVVDAVGRLVVPQQAVGALDAWSINTSSWANGVYMVAAERSNGSRRAERVFLGR